MFTGRFVLPLSSTQFNDFLAGGKASGWLSWIRAGLLDMWVLLAFTATAITYQAALLPIRPITTAM